MIGNKKVSAIRWRIAQWFERQWWKNYINKKDSKQYLDWKCDYWRQFLSDIDLIEPVQPILDIGCGPAGTFTYFKEKSITAIDPLIAQYEQTLPIFRTTFYPNTQFVNSSFEAFETASTFNTIFCLNAVNHFQDLGKSLKKMWHMLDDDGVLVLSIDAHNHSFFKHLFRLIPLDVLHPHQYDLKEYCTMLSRQGFQITKQRLVQSAFFFDYYVLVAKKP